MQDKPTTYNVEKGLSLIQRSTSPYWFAVYWHDGKHVKRSTKIAHKRGARGISEASRVARALREASRASAQARSDVSSGGILGLAELERRDKIRFLKKKGEVLNTSGEPIPGPNTRRALDLWDTDSQQIWRIIRNHFEKGDAVCNPLKLTPVKIDGFIAACAFRGAQPQSWKRYIQVLRRGLNLLLDDMKVEAPIGPQFWTDWLSVKDTAIDEKKRGKARDADLLRRFLDELGRHNEVADQIIVAAHTAARKDELLRLRLDSVLVPPDANTQWPALLVVEGEKGSSETRYVPLNAEAYAAVQRQVMRRAESGTTVGPLWSGPNFRKRIETASKRLKLTHNVTFRDLRATWASEADWAEFDAKPERMRQMGHTNEKTHDRYIKGIEAVKIRRALGLKFERPSLGSLESGPTFGPTGDGADK